jgi:ankyrin repeat protein
MKHDLNDLLIVFFVYRFLLEVNKNLINKKDNLNRTALHYAYGVGDRKMIEYLTKNGIETKVLNLH